MIAATGASEGKVTRRNAYNRKESVAVWWCDRPGFGVSLGKYVVLDVGYDTDKTPWHEYGHQKQSVMLGPLYLLVVGIPSAVFNNLWDRLFHKEWTHWKRERWYYERYPERWADRLGGVIR